MVQGCTRIPWGECHRYGKGIRKRDEEAWNLCNIHDFWCGCWQMCRWTVAVLLHMHSGFPALRLEQTIVTSLYDITRISHATVGGNYKRRAWPSLRAAVTVIWVFQHKCLGLSTSHRPSTLAVLVSPWVGSITGMHSVICLSICMHPDLFGGLLSYCDFICLMATWWTTTSSPWTWYRAKHRSQPFGSKLRRWDKSLVWCESLPVYLVYLCHPQCGPVTFPAYISTWVQ